MFRSIKPLHCDHDVILLREVIFLMDYMMLRIYSMCLYNTSMEELSIVFLLFGVLFFLFLFNSFYYLNQIVFDKSFLLFFICSIILEWNLVSCCHSNKIMNDSGF